MEGTMRKQPLLFVFSAGLAAVTMACGDPGDTSGSSDATPIAFGPSSILTCDGDVAVPWILTGDFDGDGKADILGCIAEDSVRVFLNHGSLDPVSSQISVTSGVAVHDVDGDGRSDIFWFDEEGKAQFAFSNGDGTFRQGDAQSIPDQNTCHLYVASIDGYENTVCYESGKVVVYDMVTDGSTEKAFDVAGPGLPDVVDIDADGKPDFVYAVGSTIAVQRNLGGNSFGSLEVIITASESLSAPMFVDVDGDGRTDIVTLETDSVPKTYALMHNDAATGFSSWAQFAQVHEVGYRFEDVTGDGKMDIILEQDAQIVVMVGNGDGTFAKNGSLVTGAWSDASPYEFVDLNGDRRPDIVVGGSNVSVEMRL